MIPFLNLIRDGQYSVVKLSLRISEFAIKCIACFFVSDKILNQNPKCKRFKKHVKQHVWKIYNVFRELIPRNLK